MIVYADGRRWDTVKLEELLGTQRNQAHATGVTLLGAFKTRDGRVLVVTDSVWGSGRHDGTTVGLQAHFADESEIMSLAQRYGGDIADFIPLGE